MTVFLLRLHSFPAVSGYLQNSKRIPTSINELDVSLGSISSDRAGKILEAFTNAESQPNTIMVTPVVVEIIAIRN